jgi:hypothetical protein
MDDLLLEHLPPTTETRSEDLDEIPLDVWIAQFDLFAIDPPADPPQPIVVHDPIIEELPDEESTALVSRSSMSSHQAQNLPTILPAGPVEPSSRKRKPLYDTLFLSLHYSHSYIVNALIRSPWKGETTFMEEQGRFDANFVGSVE